MKIKSLDTRAGAKVIGSIVVEFDEDGIADVPEDTYNSIAGNPNYEFLEGDIESPSGDVKKKPVRKAKLSQGGAVDVES